MRLKRESDPQCGTDNTPLSGGGCVNDGKDVLTVCGQCGIEVFCMMSSILSELIMFNIDKFTFALDNKLNFEQGCLVLGTQ